MRLSFLFLNVLFYFLPGSLVVADETAQFGADNQREKEMVQALEAYAVYKMGRHEDAFKRFLDLAELGNEQGMLNVANLYAVGVGVAENQERASFWYGEAARLGSVIAMSEYARRLDTGQGVPRDQEAAARWRSQANAANTDQSVNKTSPAQIDEQALARIHSALADLDEAARQKSAADMVTSIDDDSRVLVVLPGTTGWSPLTKEQLAALWQSSFDRTGTYRYRRYDTRVERQDDGQVTARFTVLESWRLAETTNDTKKVSRLSIDNTITFSVQADSVSADEWKLHLRE